MRRTYRELTKAKLSGNIRQCEKKAGTLPKDERVVSLSDAIWLMQIAANGMKTQIMYSDAKNEKWLNEASSIWLTKTIKSQHEVYDVKARPKGKSDEEG